MARLGAQPGGCGCPGSQPPDPAFHRGTPAPASRRMLTRLDSEGPTPRVSGPSARAAVAWRGEGAGIHVCPGRRARRHQAGLGEPITGGAGRPRRGRKEAIQPMVPGSTWTGGDEAGELWPQVVLSTAAQDPAPQLRWRLARLQCAHLPAGQPCAIGQPSDLLSIRSTRTRPPRGMRPGTRCPQASCHGGHHCDWPQRLERKLKNSNDRLARDSGMDDFVSLLKRPLILFQ